MNQEFRPAEIETPELPAVSEQELQFAMETLKGEQRLLSGSIAGLIASLLGAGVWAATTVLTESEIGIIAIGVGFLVGITVRHAGKGIDPVFGLVAALQTLFGCAAAKVLTVSYFVAQSEGVPVVDVLTQLDVETMVSMLVATFQLTDLPFYAVAAYVAYRYSFRELTADDINRALGKAFSTT